VLLLRLLLLLLLLLQQLRLIEDQKSVLHSLPLLQGAEMHALQAALRRQAQCWREWRSRMLLPPEELAVRQRLQGLQGRLLLLVVLPLVVVALLLQQEVQTAAQGLALPHPHCHSILQAPGCNAPWGTQSAQEL
jgi:hypothetical protein